MPPKGGFTFSNITAVLNLKLILNSVRANMKLFIILFLSVGLFTTATAKDTATSQHDPWAEGKYKFKKNKNAKTTKTTVDPWAEGKYKFKKNKNKPITTQKVDPWGQGKYHR